MSLLNGEDNSINNIINLGSSVHGDIKVNGFMRIDGDLEGNLESNGNVIIGEKARIKGNISAKAVTVSGVVQGNIIAQESIHLFSSSVVIGDVQTHHFRADEDVVFHGHCISLSDVNAYSDAAWNWQNTKAIVSKAIKV